MFLHQPYVGIWMFLLVFFLSPTCFYFWPLRNHQSRRPRHVAENLQRPGLRVLCVLAEHQGRRPGAEPAVCRHRHHLRQRLEPSPGEAQDRRITGSGLNQSFCSATVITAGEDGVIQGCGDTIISQ